MNVMMDQLIKDHVPSANFKALKSNCFVHSKSANNDVFKRHVQHFQVKGLDLNLCVLFSPLPLTLIHLASQKNLENWHKGASINFPPFPSSPNTSLPPPDPLSPVVEAVSSLLQHFAALSAQRRAERLL